MDRRNFLASSSSAALLTALPTALSQVAKGAASERIRAGVMGAGGRASSLNRIFAANPNVEIAAIADVDTRKLPPTIEAVSRLQGTKPKTHQDFRHLIDDKSLDVIVIGAPDHWHAIPTILACMEGKDVYVEKPDGHNIIEGQRMIAAGKKFQRVIQMGSQHRSTTRIQTAVEYIKEGHLGKCLVAKAWESTQQRALKKAADGIAPKEVDYDLWLGAAPKRPFNSNRFHGNWRWFYDYGTGDLGNDGVHRLDFAVAAMSAALASEGKPQLGLPNKISAMGGKWYFDDAQEWPDTLQVNYQYDLEPKRMITYEMRIWAPYSYHGESEGAAIYGDKGYMVIGNSRWRAFTNGDKLVKEMNGGQDATDHIENFIQCVKSREKPNCDLETVGHPVSVLCHTGNIAARVGRTLTLDPKTEEFVGDEQANQLRGRPEWRKPYVLPQI
jgi:predicted dehydrogenase